MNGETQRRGAGFKIEVVANEKTIREALDGFRYHRGYQEVRCAAKSLFKRVEGEERAESEEVSELACTLIRVLAEWGACRGNAAGYQSAEKIAKYLAQDAFREDGPLALLNGVAIGKMRAPAAGRGEPGGDEGVNKLLNAYVEALEEVADRVLQNVRGSSVYPSKVVMLLTGWGPALDSWVRAGLRKAGVGLRHSNYRFEGRGVESDIAVLQQMLLTMDALYASAEELLNKALDDRTCQDPGRLLDVLWFQQGKGAGIFERVAPIA